MGPPYPEWMSGGPAFPLLDDAAARDLHLGERSEPLFQVEAPDGSRLVTHRPWIRDAGATMRAFDARAAELAGDHTQERWRNAQLVLPHGGAFAGVRIVIDWRDDSALVCEVAAPTSAQVRRELDILDEHFGPHRRHPPLRTAGRAVLWFGAAAAVWLSAMREQQSTAASLGVAVVMYLATLAGLALLLLHVWIRGLPPRGPGRFRSGHLRTTMGWAWLAVATVFVLRVPREPYVEWPAGYWLALAGALAYGLAAVPRPRRRGGAAEPGPQARWRPLPREAFPARQVPDRVHADGGAVAAYWRTWSRIGLDEPQWNVEEHAWPSDVGEVSAQAYDTWDGAPVRVVVARAHDRTLAVRSRDAREPLALARELTDAWFGAAGGVGRTPDRAPRTTWTAAVVIGWLCALTFAVGSDLGPSTYVWRWPVDFEVDHDYPVLAAAAAAGVVLAWAWSILGMVRLFSSDAPRREWRRAARAFAWQLVVVGLGAEVLTLTLLPRLELLLPFAASAGWVLAVVHAVVVALALAVVVLIRPESALGSLPSRS